MSGSDYMKVNKIITFMTKLKQIVLKVPLEYRVELHKEFIDININREKILAVILIIVNMALLILHIILKKFLGWNTDAFMGFSIYHVILLIVPLVFLFLTCVLKKKVCENFKLKEILHMTITTLVIMLSSIIALYNIMDSKQPFSHTIAVFCIASLILFEPQERLFAFGIPYLTFITAMIIFKDGIIYKLEGIFFYSLLTIIAFMVSFIIYNSHVKNYMNNRFIIENIKMLKDMNKVVQESLKKRTEELNGIIKYEKLRTDFFANISHELRTPLTIISSAQQMLSHIFKNDTTIIKHTEVDQYMNMMGQNCYRLLRLISNLIDITKIDAGYFNVNLENYDIVRVVEDITLSIAKYIEDTNIKLTFDTEVEEKVVACDPDKIERIMLNLLSNAVKFTPKGGDIFVNIYDRADKVVISVRDTGIGVPLEMKDSIFERFVQVDKSTTRISEGSGIGLSIVKSLVEMHNGNVYLAGGQGIGSEFIFEIPNRTTADTKAIKEHNLVEKEQNSQRIRVEFSDIYL
jgi:signal transduction histidine kinase